MRQSLRRVTERNHGRRKRAPGIMELPSGLSFSQPIDTVLTNKRQ
jgi:hypothetical protein